jgi:hypothetical protein
LTPRKKYNGNILRKKLTAKKKNDVPEGTEDKVYSAVVSPIINVA